MSQTYVYVKFLLPVQIVSAGYNKRKNMKIKLNNLQHLTFYSMIRPLKYYVFGNIMENRAFAPMEQMLHFS